MKPKYSWIAVAIFLWCFFPVGAVMLVQNIIVLCSNGKQRQMLRGQGVKIAGIVLVSIAAVVAMVVVVACVFSGEMHVSITLSAFFPVVVLLVIGIVLWAVGSRRAKRMNLFEAYLNVLGTHSSLPLGVFCSTLGKTQKQVEADLRYMMKQGFFRGCYIDSQRGIFVTPNTDPFENSTTVHKHTKVYKCKNCGASKVVRDGEVPVCDYCGSGLE